MSEALAKGDDELNDMLSSLDNVEGKYTENEIMTAAGKVIENLRWQSSRSVGFVHMSRSGREFAYHVLRHQSH